MKKHLTILISALLLITFTLTLAACASKSTSVIGKYKRENNFVDYIELKADNSFTLIQDNTEYKGTYHVDDSTLSLEVKSPSEFITTGKLDGNTIVDNQNNKWIKE